MIMRTTICVLVLLGIASVASAKSAEAGDGPLAERASSSRGKAASELHEGIATKKPGDRTEAEEAAALAAVAAPIQWVNVPSTGYYSRPINCVHTAWTAWSTCSESCDGGVQSRTRSITVNADFGGVACPTILENTRNCNTAACDVDCIHVWTAWSTCTRSCKSARQTGTQKRTIAKILVAQRGLGKHCSPQEDRVCNEQSCPVDCAVPAWAAWSTCTMSCGAGSQQRTRATVEPQFGGVACPHSAETRGCNAAPCPVDGRWAGEWTPWTTCTKSCMGNNVPGTQKRDRVFIAPKWGGKANQPYSEARHCNHHACPIDGGWSAFGSCDQFCGTGSQSRTCTSPVPAHGGASCPGSATGACNTAACPKAPKCFVTASGETVVEYTDTMTPSFKCTHTAIECKCTASGHPTHHKGGCQQIDGTSGKTQSLAGDCTSTGKTQSVASVGAWGRRRRRRRT